ncbi:ACT domain-containing protein [Lactobacillus sp. HMSC08B12]|uniref:ACT domain-containing protein n=1 Tax=Lactobacillus sp. HMSC08B12 TaxID=1581136 RepID=UPI0008A1D681|nr:ACT domain-containing protein [Lactobacillus sp. HMSC08B12]OFS81627.1 hypothetical protein HMPREF3168_02310 [Lactobacillus sp. HMSC08B12]
MRAILTTVGQDKTGIIAGVSSFLAEKDINILDLSQTIMNGYFTMMMVVDVSDEADFSALGTELKELSKKLGVEINIRNEKMYAAMHELGGGLE